MYKIIQFNHLVAEISLTFGFTENVKVGEMLDIWLVELSKIVRRKFVYSIVLLE